MMETTRGPRPGPSRLTGPILTNLLMLDLWMTSRNAETFRRSPAGSGSATIDPGVAARLPFAFARDQQVVLDGGQLIAGPPGATLLGGLREAQRRAGPDASEYREETAAGFEAALMRAYQTGAGGTDDPELSFDLEETGTTARDRDLLEEASDAPVIQLVNQLLRRAVSAGASDLHVEPYEGGLRAACALTGFCSR